MTAVALHVTTGSAIERLDPRAKILAALLLTIALVVGTALVVKATIVAALVATWFLARLSGRTLALTVGSLLFFFVTTMVLRAVIRPAGAADTVTVLGLPISPAGVLDGAQMCAQILGIVLALVILVRATAPVVLAEGLELLLQPLRRIGVPTHEGALMFSIAMRFLPIMTAEFSRLQTAQLARGGGVHRRGLHRRVTAVLPLLIPLFIVTLTRAKELSEAMDARGYRGEEGRTRIRSYRMGASDAGVIALAASAVIAAIAVAL